MKRGYCGIGIENIKSSCNYGTLFRSALCFEADFLFLIGRRFKQQASNTVAAQRHLPLYEYASTDDFIRDGIPYDCRLIGVEIAPEAKPIKDFAHPERAIYVLGAEDSGLSKKIRDKCWGLIEIPSIFCLNVAVAGSIVLYDRLLKEVDNEI